MLRENESTMNIQSELNKLDLCMEISTGKDNIIFNNIAILEHYKEYRTEQELFSKIKHYEEIYKLKQIYNCNCNVFNIYHLILFCIFVIIILFLLYYKLKQ